MKAKAIRNGYTDPIIRLLTSSIFSAQLAGLRALAFLAMLLCY